jgi:hypothetical protein
MVGGHFVGMGCLERESQVFVDQSTLSIARKTEHVTTAPLATPP